MKINRKTARHYSLALTVCGIAAIGAGCGSDEESAATEIVESSPEELAFQEVATELDSQQTTKKTASTANTSKINETSENASASTTKSKTLNTLASESQGTLEKETAASSTTQTANATNSSATTTASTQGQATNTCSTSDYTVTIPTGWQTASGTTQDCVLFATVPLTNLECDCTVGVTIRSYPNQTAADRTAALVASATSTVSPSPVLNGTATLLDGTWELSEVQTGNTGQTEQKHIYIFSKGQGSIEVAAGSFQDLGGNELYQDREAAVDQIAASLAL